MTAKKVAVIGKARESTLGSPFHYPSIPSKRLIERLALVHPRNIMALRCQIQMTARSLVEVEDHAEFEPWVSEHR